MLSPFAEFILTACPSNRHADGCAACAHHHHATVCDDSLVVDDIRGVGWATVSGHLRSFVVGQLIRIAPYEIRLGS